MLDRILFPADNFSGYNEKSYPGYLFFLPKTKTISYQIPCLWYENTNSSILLIVSHGNSADIGCYTDFKEKSIIWNVNILIYEYPGYGYCSGISNNITINQHLEYVFEFIEEKLSWPLKNIVFYGRSIGSGPVCYFVSNLYKNRNYNVGGLILQSPYSSIKDLITYHSSIVLSTFFKERWDNKKYIQSITSPILFIHGELDTLIPYQHTELLYNNCSSTLKMKYIYNYADHNYFKGDDIVIPISKFIKNISMNLNNDSFKKQNFNVYDYPYYHNN